MPDRTPTGLEILEQIGACVVLLVVIWGTLYLMTRIP